ncbi:hypothetical protein [Paractinoplanes atraurantiacus]|uniref:Uncharacterized protein n=1 Tax=Paractinoplanes atraurantiacus TaxID=1036182 RepID=A0A285KIP3_9ACTN|nr:hypothetical protein [Actinoplanes atraurantiacus]SNY71171.1 hypothetical protein SAMN05421748_13942 [Actinoplanes atraurantiacus]
MSRLTWINFWPPAGFTDRPWLEHPDEDALVRSSRSVCELYTEAVAPAGLQARHSELRLFCQHADDLLLEVDTDRGEGFECARAELPPGIAELPAPTRAALALELVHAAASRLARERGWDQTVLDAARQHALDNGLRFRWQGPPKTSPDRKLTAHPLFVLHDDGFARATIQIRRRADGHPLATSEPAPTNLSTSPAFARSARTLRWHGSRKVTSDLLTISLDDSPPPSEPAPDAPAEAPDLPTIVALRRSNRRD